LTGPRLHHAPHAPASPSSIGVLRRWLLVGEWRAQPVRTLVAIAAIAVGVALGFAIHLINAAAFNEFSSAVKSLSGQADIQVAGREALFDETVYPVLARRDGVEVASPVLELNASLPGRAEPLKIIGLDAMRAALISPDLLGVSSAQRPSDSFADDALFLSPAALDWLGYGPQPASHASRPAMPSPDLQPVLQVLSGSKSIALRVAGTIERARVGQRLGVMDLGAAQWRLGRLGQLSRIDLKLRQGVNRASFETALAAELEARFPGRFSVSQPSDDNQNSRNDNLSRAYRVNLTVLALVALFTGAFLVFSTQALSVIRRRSQFALLRVLGMARGELLRQVLLEGALLGVAGALLGIGAGYAMAAAALHFFGGDLGAGYFSGVRPEVQFTPVAALVYFALGVGVAVLGCAAPAWEAARAAPAVALKSGAEERALAGLSRTAPAIACLIVAALMTQAPPVAGLPIFGYLSIALMLIGAIALMPRLAGAVFRLANNIWQRRASRNAALRPPPPVPTLTLARLANASGQAGIALGGVLSSFSLMVAMAIMVASFRVSVDDWLLRILPADLYVRSASGGNTGSLGPREQDALKAVPGVARIQFQRNLGMSLAPDRPSVALLAREIDPRDPGAALVLVGPSLQPAPGQRPVWISEAAADIYHLVPGKLVELPLHGRLQRFFIAGVWRDYARQTGAIVLGLQDYRALTGDLAASDAAIWLAPGAAPATVAAAVKALPFGAGLDLAATTEIRALSLKIFDRSFAVTYLLEAIAIVIGVFGVGATFSAQTLARAREFGMLRHVGVTRGQILSILAIEGGALTALGIATGFALGWLISLILVFIVNPQSFHWTMQLHFPWPLLGSVALALLVAAALTALISGRQALSGGPIRAVREDW
jgi:putative ABC transport system permease protein